MRSNGWETYGVEISEKLARYGMKKRGLNVSIGSLEEAGFPNRYFDVIYMSQVIEHMTDPLSSLREVQRMLKTRGILVISTPNISSLQTILFRRNWRGFGPPYHLTFFSRHTLELLLKRLGFKVVSCITWGGIPKGKTNRVIKKVVDYLVKRLNIGDVMMVCAEKL